MAAKKMAKLSGRNVPPPPVKKKDMSSQRAETARQTRSKPKPSRTGPETGPGTYVPPVGSGYVKPGRARGVDGGALRAGARKVTSAQRNLDNQKKKFKQTQPKGTYKQGTPVTPPTAKRPKGNKFGRTGGGGTPTYDYWS